ncbi:MAG: rubrerythrin [Ruminococcus sp.]|jgi:rubrerythrin
MDFKNSKTKDNLMRAFAGESQARNRYTFAASTARKQKIPLLEAVFLFTANQEKEHGEIFYNHLKTLSGETIHVDGTYPVEVYDDLSTLLRCAQHNEYEEFDPIYKSFGDIAKGEGFNDVAFSFYSIAKIEKVHGDRFGTYAQWLEEGRLFKDHPETLWMCLNCGHIYAGEEVPSECPVCHEEQGYFIRLPLAPYTDSKMADLR